MANTSPTRCTRITIHYEGFNTVPMVTFSSIKNNNQLKLVPRNNNIKIVSRHAKSPPLLRTDASRQRRAPHPAAPSQADQLWCPLQAVAHIAGETQRVTDVEAVAVPPPELRLPGILAWLQRVFCTKTAARETLLRTLGSASEQ